MKCEARVTVYIHIHTYALHVYSSKKPQKQVPGAHGVEVPGSDAQTKFINNY